MIKIIAKKDFSTNIGNYVEGEEIEGLNYQQIAKLNELGFIEPLTFKDLVLIKRELEKPKKKEALKWD